jgi:hypothetical protein
MESVTKQNYVKMVVTKSNHYKDVKYNEHAV